MGPPCQRHFLSGASSRIHRVRAASECFYTKRTTFLLHSVRADSAVCTDHVWVHVFDPCFHCVRVLSVNLSACISAPCSRPLALFLSLSLSLFESASASVSLYLAPLLRVSTRLSSVVRLSVGYTNDHRPSCSSCTICSGYSVNSFYG